MFYHPRPTNYACAGVPDLSPNGDSGGHRGPMALSRWRLVQETVGGTLRAPSLPAGKHDPEAARLPGRMMTSRLCVPESKLAWTAL